MVPKVICVDKDESLKRVLDLMQKYQITKIPVVDNKRFFGLVTDNVIAYKLGSIRKKSVTASRLHASSVTEKNVMTVSPDDQVKTILKSVGEPGPTMLPVLEKEKLIGVVTKADLLPLVKSREPLSSIMQRKLYVIAPEDRVIHARRVMINEGIARLPVVDKNKLVGMLSDIEIALAFASLKKSFSLGKQKHQLDELTVREIMRSPVISSTPDSTILEAAKCMTALNVGSLPLLENGRLVGMVTRTDLIRTIEL
ncbi:MAG TPA: CBS domain-containing protein [Candidatus Thermoplasmatota archaeon]|nr:CBS domain-containing protein [Candidatus Thermoplasmatota archaeon]